MYYYLCKYVIIYEVLPGCEGHVDGVYYKKYQAVRFDLETGNKYEISDEEFFEAIK